MSSEHDAFLRTASALSTTFRAHAELLTSAPARFCNLMLDECGSDHRPLVDLLLTTGLLVRPRLLQSPLRTPWEARRAPLVHQLVATRYLQPDVARWLVDAWGAALAVAPTQIAQPIVASAGGRQSDAGETPTGGGAVAPPPARTASYARPVPLPAPPAPKRSRFSMRPAPTTAAPAASPVTHPGMARAAQPRWRTRSPAMTTAQLAKLRQLERLSWGAIASAAVGVFVAAIVALSGRKTEAVAATAGLPAVGIGSVADSIGMAAIGPMVPLPASAADTPGATASTTTARTTALSAPLDGPHLIARGVFGRYRVEQRMVAVTGSRSCAKVAEVLARGRSSVEVIAHTPGTFSFTLASRDVTGTLTADAFFDAGPMRGTTDGVTWQFRMSGHFTADGFTAETHTTTEAVLRWGRTQSCATVAELVAVRLSE